MMSTQLHDMQDVVGNVKEDNDYVSVTVVDNQDFSTNMGDIDMFPLPHGIFRMLP